MIEPCPILPHVFQNGTCGLSLDFTTFVNVVQMLCDSCSLCSEQHRHLCLREPYSVLLHSYFQPDAAVGLVEDDFAVLCQRFVFFHNGCFFVLRLLNLCPQRYNKKPCLSWTPRFRQLLRHWRNDAWMSITEKRHPSPLGNACRWHKNLTDTICQF